MRAFIFTTDALFAVILMAFLVLAALTLLQRTALLTDNSIQLHNLCYDSIRVMEHTSILERAITQNRTDEMRYVVNSLPPNICATTNIYLGNGTLIARSSTVGCDCSAARDLVTAKRSFLAANGSSNAEYYGEVQGCYR